MNAYIKAGLVGIFAGMRSMAGPALVSHAYSGNGYRRIRKSPLRFLSHSSVSNTLKAAAIGELLIDKLPKIPARTKPGLLSVRVSAGALSGAAVSLAENKNIGLGALIGGASAAGAAYLFKFLREKAERKSGVSNTIAGLAEDAVLISSGLTVLAKAF
jgi:uncharacterized membrane protein